MSAFTKLFGTHSERELKRIYPLVDKVESYRDAMGALSDEELRDKTKEYKERLEKGETLMIFYRRHMQPSVKQQNVCLEWSITACRSSVVLSYIRDVSQR